MSSRTPLQHPSAQNNQPLQTPSHAAPATPLLATFANGFIDARAQNQTHQQLRKTMDNSSQSMQQKMQAAQMQSSPATLQLQKTSQLMQASSTPVIQFEDPWDTYAKTLWKEKISTSLHYAYSIGLFDVEETHIVKYLKENNIEPPDKIDFDEDDFPEYKTNLDGISIGEMIEQLHQRNQEEDIFQQWKYFESTDPEPEIQSGDDLHYSSEEDETPDDKKEFSDIIDVIRQVSRLLDNALENHSATQAFGTKAKEVIQTITTYKKENPNQPFPGTGFNEVTLEHPEDWMGFGQAFHEAKSSVTQKPTSYNLKFNVWDKAKYNEIKFRGKQLKDAYGNEGRSWAAIAVDLHMLAGELGTMLEKVAQENSAEVGTRILASAILAIIAGEGNQVKAYLTDNGFKNLDVFESIVLEFLTLSLGIENIRLPFSQLDIVFHLMNIANGKTMGNTDNRYSFLNVFGPFRNTDDGYKFVAIKGQYTWGRTRPSEDYSDLDNGEIIDQINDQETDVDVIKELTPYQGFHTAPVDDHTSTSKKRGERNSAKSSGKSSVTHSAGHNKTNKLLAGSKEITDSLWRQVKRTDNKSRREKHKQRLFSMGPIRLYNLFANILKDYPRLLQKLEPRVIAFYLIDLYLNFMSGTEPGSDNPFRGELPTVGGPDFSHVVNNILLSERVVEIDQDKLEQVKGILVKEPGTLITRHEEHQEEVELLLSRLLLDDFRGEDDNSLLHIIVNIGNENMANFLIKAGADLQAQNQHGETPLALAIHNSNASMVSCLSHGIDSQTKKKKNSILPDEWQEFTKKKKLDDAWLDDAGVRTELENRDLANTVIAPAVDIIQNPNLLAHFIRENYLAQMNTGYIETHTVIPINFNNQHWATLVIVQNDEDRSRPKVYFFDPLGNEEEKTKLIKLMLRMTGIYVNAEVTDLSLFLQDDGYTCGTWLIESAVTIVSLLEEGADVKDITQHLRELPDIIKELHSANLNKTRARRHQQGNKIKLRFWNPPKSLMKKNALLEYRGQQYSVESFIELYDNEFEFTLQ